MTATLQLSTLAPSRAAERAWRAHSRGDFHKAEQLYGAVLAERPDDFAALYGLGDINYRRGRLDTALVLFRAAVEADPARAEGFAGLGLVLHGMRRFAQALASYDQGLRLAPDDYELHNRRGVALLELRRPEEALLSFERAVALGPDKLEALGNFGNALLKLNRPEEALAAYDRALLLARDNVQVLTNRAVALRRMDRPHEALLSATRALARQPDFAQAQFVASVARLTLGDFADGWSGYESRWRVGALALQRRSFTAPLWLGCEPLHGKTILLHAEQGFGDTIQFVRYAPLLAERGATVVLEVQRELVRLCSELPGVAAVVGRGAPLPHFDCHCPLLSLPLALATQPTAVPAKVPYLGPIGDDAAAWRQRLPQTRPLVGIAWSGAPAHENDRNRSMRLETLAPLFALPDVQCVSLQHVVRDEDKPLLRNQPNLVGIADQVRDFADTAAAVAALDAVVSVDTAVAHLAGAMGKPLFLLLPLASDFRWMRDRPDSPWYPTARLYRQPRFGDWNAVIEAMIADLTRMHGRSAA